MKGSFEDMLNSYLPTSKDIRKKEEDYPVRPAKAVTPDVKRMVIEAELDLHGYTVAEALEKTEQFLKNCLRKNYRKVLIIHGKGKHNDSEGRLKKEVRQYLERHSNTGAMGHPDRKTGGSGALWVFLKKNKH
ncbi:MAG: Smr/MutS family protein [Spirochaetia bacterium]